MRTFRFLVAAAALVWLAGFFGQAYAAGDSMALLDTGYRDLYNLQFDEAHNAFQTWQGLHPLDPLGPVSDAAVYLYSEFNRLHVLQLELFSATADFSNRFKFHPDPATMSILERKLGQTERLADAALVRNPENGDALFSQSLLYSLRSDYLTMIERRNLAGLNSMKEAASLAERLLSAHPDWYDAYLPVGVENYLLSLKPALVRWLLRLDGAETDRRRGIQSLRLTAEKGHYLLPYARLLLAAAALHDKQRERARGLLRGLARNFPGNRLYAEELRRLRREPDSVRARLR